MKTILLVSFCIAFVSANTYGSYGGYSAEQKVLKPIVPIVRFLHNSDNHGSYSHESEGGDGTKKSESGTLKNINNQIGSVKSGSYEWTSPEGQHFQVSYTADENGFKPVASHLPVSPPIPDEIARVLPLLPKLKEENSYDSYATRVESYSAPVRSSYDSYTHHTSYAAPAPAPMPSTSFKPMPPAPLPTMETTFPLLVGPPAIPSPDIDTADFSIHTSDPSRTFVRIGH